MTLTPEELARVAAMIDRGEVAVRAAGATPSPFASDSLSYAALLARRSDLVRPPRG
jgi:hypothetical protein